MTGRGGGTTVASQEVVEIEDQPSLLSDDYVGNMGMKQYVTIRQEKEIDEDKEREDTGEDETNKLNNSESENEYLEQNKADPPIILRISGESKIIQELSEAGVAFPASLDMSKVSLSRKEWREREEMDVEQDDNNVFNEKDWCKHLLRN